LRAHLQASFQKQNGELPTAKRLEVIEQYHEVTQLSSPFSRCHVDDLCSLNIALTSRACSQALRRLLAAMVAEGKWESVRELVGLVRPQYETKLAAMPRLRTLFQELRRFQDGAADYLARHGECRCLPVHFAVYLSQWPWQGDNAQHGDADTGDSGVWLLIKSDPVQALCSRGTSSAQKFTLPSHSGYHAVLQRLRKWFPNYRLMPPGAIKTQQKGRQSLYMQLYHAVPRFARGIATPKKGRERIIHTADLPMQSRPTINRTASFASSLPRANISKLLSPSPCGIACGD
jgi:hypothetical protein